jgi:hypothetical protein
MSDLDRPRRQSRTVLGVSALIALPVLCCAGPALLGGAALTAGLGVLGGALASPWLLGTAVVVALAVGAWWWRRRTSVTHGAACCLPEPPEPDSSSGHPDRSPIQHQER